MRRYLGHLLGIWQDFDIRLGQRSKLRHEFDIGLELGSNPKVNRAEECVFCILMGLDKTLNTVTRGPSAYDLFVPSLSFLCFVSSLTTFFMS